MSENSLPNAEAINARLVNVGLICTQWSYLELLLARTIWRILDLDEGTGKIVTGGLDILPRVRMALTLSKHTSAPRELINALDSARSEIQNCIDDRNLAVHGVIPANPKTGETRVEGHRLPKHRTPRNFDPEWLRGIADQIQAISESLQEPLTAFGVNVE